MDEDEGNALEEFSAELEEHLYSKIHHGQVDSEVRVEAQKTVTAPGQKAKGGRYFSGAVAGKQWVKKVGKKSAPILGLDKQPVLEGSKSAPKFTPYKSFLEGIKVLPPAQIQKNPNMRKNPAKMFRKPEEVVRENVPEIPKSKKKNRRKGKKQSCETIVLDSSEEEKDDDVVEIPVPPPPLIDLDSSDESEVPKKNPRIIPRGSSPSSSILSDDFIAVKDRRRLIEPMDTIHVADEELRTVQQQSKPPSSPHKRLRIEETTQTGAQKAPLSDISTSDSEDFLPDGDASPKRFFQKRKRLPPSPKEIPYILRGEALPNAVTVPKRRSIDTAISSHRSDEEFMTILNSIANGETSNSQNASNSDHEPVEIVHDSPDEEARDIVLNIVSREASPLGVSEDELPLVSELPEADSEAECEAIEEGEEHSTLSHGWNEEMRHFYNESWGEEFSVKKIMEKMPLGNQWQISAKDLNFSRFHRTWREPQIPKLVCFMCGEKGHREPRCPNTLCLKCGNRTMVFGTSCSRCANWASSLCSECGTQGHKKELCPDLWRRYHSTMDNTMPLNTEVANNERKYCSMCARKGHTFDQCSSPVRILEYPVTPTRIASYQGTYESSQVARNPPDPFKMHRGENVKFQWNDRVKNSPWYGRFLKQFDKEEESSAVEETKEVEPEPEETPKIPVDKAESQIHLHRDFSNHLIMPCGQEFLKNLADELFVEVNLRSSDQGNILRLRGEKANLKSFRQRLFHYLDKLSKEKAKLEKRIPQSEGEFLPHNRQKLINILVKKMQMLKCYIGNARELFTQVRDMNCSPKYIYKARTMLNMILMGQVGLRDGKHHLKALESDLAVLRHHQQLENVPAPIRNRIIVHFRYIFTDFKHKKYEELMWQFEKLLSSNKLPPAAVPGQKKIKNSRWAKKRFSP
ncbi:uncharacterized protein LOC132259622 [Phlebotomus argentipes]|uniref:uncharacterized protein LOC132259622 n=1 Tax=Phlebotomus argentipes TaxID=94469 RepID=UPI00289375E1|nr:uncharacterized protein LOC132259622 [Phlebotomus argentipes]